jgi:hypothetical protein
LIHPHFKLEAIGKDVIGRIRFDWKKCYLILGKVTKDILSADLIGRS